jgi:hypothetical protein
MQIGSIRRCSELALSEAEREGTKSHEAEQESLVNNQ